MNTLCKSQRLNKQKIIEQMFAGGSRSFAIFPLRVIYLPAPDLEAPAAVLLSVSKRRFKQAVRRNRVKRQLREAYRKQQQLLLPTLEAKGIRLAIAFIYLSDRPADTAQLEACVQTALARIAEQINRETS
ncbi:MAG: ribonuclease P protein component [Prevotellaceae bacterium]|nr:ribonuclease P protein component [Prevotellaceae bacterium]